LNSLRRPQYWRSSSAPGSRLAATRAAGSAAALHERLGISTREATRLIDALEHAGTIRWIEPRINTVRPVVPPGDIG
jgi:DNA-binding IclR family transcriptional regulator